MRWPWQRKKPDAPYAQFSGAPAAAPPAAFEPALSPAGWSFLPPLQRVVGDLQTTTAPRRFTDRLPTRTDPSFTGSMSHLVSADAPRGVIDLDGPHAGSAPARPGSVSAPEELVFLPPPRSPAGQEALHVQRTAGGRPADARPLISAPSGDLGVLQLPVVQDPDDSTGTGRDDVVVQTARAVQAVAPREGATVVDHSSGQEAVAGGSRPRIPDPAAGSHGDSSPRPVTPEMTLPLQRQGREPNGSAWEGSIEDVSTYDGIATIVPLPSVSPAGRTMQIAEPAAPPPTRPVVGNAPSSPRRFGLGRPWSEHRPPSGNSEAEPSSLPTLQRSPAPPAASDEELPEPGARSASAEVTSPPAPSPAILPVVARESAPLGPKTSQDDPGRRRPGAPDPFPDAPATRTLRRARGSESITVPNHPTTPVPSASEGPTSRAGTETQTLQRAVAPEPLPMVSRSPAEPTAVHADRGRSAGDGTPAVVVRSSGVDSWTAPPSAERTPTVHGVSAAPRARPTGLRPALDASVLSRSAIATGVSFANVPPTAPGDDGGLPDEPTSWHPAAKPLQRTMSAPVALPSADRRRTSGGDRGSAAEPVRARPESPGTASAVPLAGSVQRQTALSDEPAEARTVPSPESATGMGTGSRADDGPTTSSAVSAPVPPADEGMTQEQVDELARRLVGPIVRRIKADMLLDRERRGRRTDAI